MIGLASDPRALCFSWTFFLTHHHLPPSSFQWQQSVILWCPRRCYAPDYLLIFKTACPKIRASRRNSCKKKARWSIWWWEEECFQ